MLLVARKLADALQFPAIRHAVAISVLGALAIVLCFCRLDERALWSSHEGRAGQHAQLMLDTGCWGMPTLYFGEADYQKPPLYYWLVAWVARLRGGDVDAWTVRFPASAAAVLGVCLIYVTGAAFGRTALGAAAALIMASSLRYAWLARVGRIDMPLAVAVAAVLVCSYAAYGRIKASPSARGVWPWMLAAYLAVSLAVMLKGPVGLVLPVIPMLLFLAWERQPVWPWQRGFGALMHRFGIWWGIPLVLLCVGPWFVWASVVTHGAFFKTFFLHHNWDRTLGVEGLKPEPVWYYVPQIFLDMFPWSVLIPAAIWRQVRQANTEHISLGRFALCWSAGMFGFLSLVRFKRHDYLLPLVPGLALLLSTHWHEMLAMGRTRRDARWTLLFSAVLVSTACVVGGVILNCGTPFGSTFLDGSVVRGLLHETDRILTSELCASITQAAGALKPVALALPFVAACIAWLIYRRRPTASVATIAAAWSVLFLSYVRQVLPALEPLREQRTIAAAARQFNPQSSRLYYYGREDQQLMFYLGPQARWLPNRIELWPVITRSEPVFIVMELDRFKARQTDWPGVTMVPLVRNTDNPYGTHCNPAVLVTNAGGRRLVEARHEGGMRAN